jgi:hypothetical protein
MVHVTPYCEWGENNRALRPELLGQLGQAHGDLVREAPI